MAVEYDKGIKKPKQRMWGLFLVAIIMFLWGLIANIAVGRSTIGFVSYLWLAVLWLSATGNVSAIKKVSGWAITIQGIGICTLIFFAFSPGKGFLELLPNGIDFLSIFIPLIVWGLVFWRSNSVYQKLTAENQSFEEPNNGDSLQKDEANLNEYDKKSQYSQYLKKIEKG